MKGKLLIFSILSAFAVMAFAVTASAGNSPSTPPGWDPCSHGNTNKPCRPDPQPDNGKDCEHHGNHGGVNEDHCKGETPPPPECKGDECHPQPPPQGHCPEGYSEDSGSTPKVLLCTRTVTVTNTVTNTVEVPGPTQTVVQTVYGNPQCPAGTTETSRGQGMVVCQTPGPERVIEKVVEKTRIVYGHPKCPAHFKMTKRGKGFVACTRTVVKNHIKTVVKVRVVTKPKPAYTK
jgi:hypothetical protein